MPPRFCATAPPLLSSPSKAFQQTWRADKHCPPFPVGAFCQSAAHPGAIDKQKKHPHSTNHLGAIAPSGEAASPTHRAPLRHDNPFVPTIELATVRSARCEANLDVDILERGRSDAGILIYDDLYRFIATGRGLRCRRPSQSVVSYPEMHAGRREVGSA